LLTQKVQCYFSSCKKLTKTKKQHIVGVTEISPGKKNFKSYELFG